MLWLAKLEGQIHLSPLTLNIESQDSGFAMLGFSLALVQYFLTVFLILPLWNGNGIFFLTECWKCLIRFLIFLQGVTIKSLAQKRLNFGHLNNVGT